MFTICPQKQTNHIFCPVYAKCQERQVTVTMVNIIFTKYLILLSLNTKTLQKCIFSKLPPSPLPTLFTTPVTTSYSTHIEESLLAKIVSKSLL